MVNDLIPRHQLVDMLHRCRSQFSFYATNHRVKVPALSKRRQETKDTSPTAAKLDKQIADTITKAQANELMMSEIDKLIGPPEVS